MAAGQAESFSQIANDELDNLIRDILTVTPQSGGDRSSDICFENVQNDYLEEI